MGNLSLTSRDVRHAWNGYACSIRKYVIYKPEHRPEDISPHIGPKIGPEIFLHITYRPENVLYVGPTVSGKLVLDIARRPARVERVRLLRGGVSGAGMAGGSS